MDFGILGPLQIRDGEREIPLTGAKQLAVLAILLLHAGEIVSSDRLIDDLWGDDPPESGITALQVRVSQLRKALGPAAEQLETRAPGYVIRLGADELDLQRFERLVAQAEPAEPEMAAGLLRDALALWRGPALTDFAYEPFAQAAIGRLEELRLTALERRIEADLALTPAGSARGTARRPPAQGPGSSAPPAGRVPGREPGRRRPSHPGRAGTRLDNPRARCRSWGRTWLSHRSFARTIEGCDRYCREG
jgi:Bacterial transcriptional activator domain